MEREKLIELLSDMSFEEKVGQLLQVAGHFFAKDALITGDIGKSQITEKDLELTGSILSVSGAEKLKRLQDVCMERQPHHIPQLFMLDIINGYETIYPIPLGQGASFNPSLTKELAQMAAKEGAAAGLHVTFSPMADLVRDARWGRVMEACGEDSYLNARMAEAMVRGYQGENPKEKGRLASCVKHFAGYGAPEGGRDYDNVELSERTLREEYLPGYEAAIEAGAKLVMTSFNTLNRIPSSGNRWLLRNVLREEMGFTGMVISDYSAVEEMISHRIARDEKEAARLAIEAGLDMEMMSLCYAHGLKELVEEGIIEESLIDESVLRILELKNDLGLFENPYKDADEQEEEKLLLCKEHRELCKRAAAESFVLVKNEEEILPLCGEKEETIAFIGPYVDSKRVYGSWSFPKKEDAMVTIKEGIENLSPKAHVSFYEGTQFFGENLRLKDGEQFVYDASKRETLLAEALEAAKHADKVVLCIGEHSQQTGEAGSRTVLQVPQEQMELFREVRKITDQIITIVFTGRPLELEEIAASSKAVMITWMPGTECGNAVAECLFGTCEPGGRIPMGFPYRATQMPNYYNRFATGRPNHRNLNESFVMGYTDQIDAMLYPFGYGLTYSTFSYSKVQLSASSMTKESTLTATVSVQNTGSRVATETVQLYLADLYGSVIRPTKQLRGFKKVTLCPGETKEVSFTIEEKMLRFYTISMEYTSEPGEFEVYIGPDSETTNKAGFTLQ